jgi:conjugal transfer ATP-binding protein TraC
VNPLPDLSRDQDLPSLAGLLPYHSVDPEGSVVLLSDASSAAPEWMGLVFRLAPADTETLSPESLGALAARLTHVVEALPEGTAAQILQRTRRDIRRDLEGWNRATRTEDPLLERLASSRAQALHALAVPIDQTTYCARQTEILFTIARKGGWAACEAGLLEAIGLPVRGSSGALSALPERTRHAYRKDREELLATAETLESLFASAQLQAVRLGEEELARALYERLNPRRAKTQSPWSGSEGELLRSRLCDSSLEADLDGGQVSLDGVRHAVVSVIGLPPATVAGMLSRPGLDPRDPTLVEMAPEMDLAINLWVGDQEELRRRQSARRRLATNQSQNVHQSPSLGPMREELFELEEELARGARIVSIRVHAVPRAESPARALDLARVLVTRLANLGLRAILEDTLAPTLWLQTLPLAYRPDNDRALRRARTLLAGNAAHLLPLYGGFRGTPRATQMLLSRAGETIPVSFFNGCEVPHAIITGKSGSGKSVFANDLILQALRTGGRVFVLDRGGSYRKLSEILGGTYLAYDLSPRRINPCGRSPRGGKCPEELQSFLRDWLTEMCTQGKGDLPVPDQNLLSCAVRSAFARREGEEVTLSDLHRGLLDLGAEHPSARALALSLLDFTRDGAYGNLFDGPGDVDFGHRLVAIDLGNLVKKKAVGPVILMALIQKVAEVAAAWPHEEKYLIIDEGWTLLASSATARFLEDVARTARKNRLSLVMLSQQLTDFRGESGRAILDQASTKVLLHHDQEAIRATADLMGLSPREVELYQSLRTSGGRWSEVFLRTPFGSGVARLVMDPLSYWLSTTDPRDKEVLEKLRAKHERAGIQGRKGLEQALLDASLRYPSGAPAGNPPREAEHG